ncbi:MAG TPA: (d)CMP kinase [Candidatus Baltobacteraceae bacterium]|nr:(d)CMP kinase [Candidatus Baltobacteraceae bacterium]
MPGTSSHLQIAIDGPAASGKTTVARRVAERLNVLYLDTGAMYRALAYAALRTQTDLDNENALVRLFAQHRIHVTLDSRAPLGFHIYAGNRELSQNDLESPEVTAVVSTIAAHARVREAMVEEQRRIAQAGPVVMAGRDIGTVVLPDAQVKIFLTASVQARVQRRRAQLEEAGVDVSAHELAKEIEERDRLDETRASSPLRKAADAIVIDSSTLSVDDVVQRIVDRSIAAPSGNAHVSSDV